MSPNDQGRSEKKNEKGGMRVLGQPVSQRFTPKKKIKKVGEGVGGTILLGSASGSSYFDAREKKICSRG